MITVKINNPQPPPPPPATVTLEMPLETAEILVQLLYTAVSGSGQGRRELDEVSKALQNSGINGTYKVRFSRSAFIADEEF